MSMYHFDHQFGTNDTLALLILCYPPSIKLIYPVMRHDPIATTPLLIGGALILECDL